MPDKRHHRGAHPEDAKLFAPAMWPALRLAVAELSWLLSRDYALPSSLKLVGDRHNLTERQRTAVMRCACSDSARQSRLSRQVEPSAVAGRIIHIDAYNFLTTIETALAGGVVLVGRDTAWRDMASIHGTWRKVEETQPALQLAGEMLAALGAGPCVWYLDKPVSNSGRLATIMREIASQHDWDWRVEIVPNPDAVLAESDELIVTADSVVLDRCGPWLNLVRPIITERVPSTNLVDLCDREG
jgi:hypothetical protein